jgi:hypothetical protein
VEAVTCLLLAAEIRMEIPAKVSPPKIRQNSRIVKEIAILLIGSDMEGKTFSERTKTVVLSRHGAGVVSQHRVAPEQEIIIRRLDTNKQTAVRVVGLVGSQSGSYTYGLAFLDPNINFWGIEFPPVTESEKKAGHGLFECSSCKGRDTFDLNDLESDIYAINEGMARYCKHCRSSTVWKRTSGEPDDRSVSPKSGRTPEPSLTPTPAARPEDRRKHVRAKVNFTACIRCPGSDDDIVVCEDMSRSGLRFKSRKPYFELSMIEVAVPYSPSALNIFVPALIDDVQELPAQKLFRCDVSFIKSSKSP